MKKLLSCIADCTLCASHLPLWPRPVVSAHPKSRIVLIWQAPWTKVHASWIPRDDKSWETLRARLWVTKEQFYDPRLFAIVPMGFCYPGKGKSWDLPPRKECAPARHAKLLEAISDIKLTILIGQYAQKYYLWKNMKKNLTQTVRERNDVDEKYFPLPHPSPRNNIWMAKNPRFQIQTIPDLRQKVKHIIT